MTRPDATRPRLRRDMINGQIDFLKERALVNPGEPRRSAIFHFTFASNETFVRYLLANLFSVDILTHGDLLSRQVLCFKFKMGISKVTKVTETRRHGRETTVPCHLSRNAHDRG